MNNDWRAYWWNLKANNGAESAFQALYMFTDRLLQKDSETNQSRVFEVFTDPTTNQVDYIRRSMKYVSDAIDMADCHGDLVFKYLEVDGTWHDVTVGNMTRNDPDDRGKMPFHYGSAPIVANGKVLGYVTYTDH